MRLVFFGPPGSGKGTQADVIADHFGLVHLSTGRIFRDEVQKGTDLGLRIKEIMESGALVDDSIVNEQIFGRIDRVQDFLLDGFPRNTRQARELDLFLEETGKPLTGVLMLVVPDDVVVARLSGRVTCSGCGFVAGSVLEPGVNCPQCGSTMCVREDDRPEVVRERLRHYSDQTEPLIEFYSGRMLDVDGVGTVREVSARILEALASWR